MEQIIAIVLGFAATHTQGFLFAHEKWSERTRVRVRFFIALSLSIFGGCLVHAKDFLDADGFDWEMLLANIGVVFTTSQTYYQMYFRHTK